MVRLFLVASSWMCASLISFARATAMPCQTSFWVRQRSRFIVRASAFSRKFDPSVPALRVGPNTCADGVTFVLSGPAQIRPATRATAVAQHSGYGHPFICL